MRHPRVIPDGPDRTESAMMPARRRVLLLAAFWGAGCDHPPANVGASAAIGDVQVTKGVAWGLASSRSTTVGFHATAASGDTLVDVSSPDGVAMLHDNATGRMTHLERLAIPAGGAVTLGTGGPHIMMTSTTHGYARGDSVRLVLQWARSGRLTVTVPLQNFTDAATLLERR